MTNYYDIFLSYSRKNLQVVKEIKETIEQGTNATCWMDLEGIESGTPKFTKSIISAINACPIFLFMLSDESQKSENALKELDFAYKKYKEEGKKVVIVYIEECKMTDEFYFDYGKADTINWQETIQNGKLIRDIIKWTKKPHKDIEQREKKMVSRLIERDGKWGYADLNWKITIQPKWKRVTRFKDGLASVEDFNGKCGYINMDGEVVIPFVWSYAGSFTNGLARVQDQSGFWGFINKNGDTIIPCTWMDVSGFSKGLACVVNANGKYGYINRKGEVTIKCVWEAAYGFNSVGLARVKNYKNEWGYINTNGSLVIPCQWKSTEDFYDGYARVTNFTGETLIIDITGKIISKEKSTFFSSRQSIIEHYLSEQKADMYK